MIHETHIKLLTFKLNIVRRVTKIKTWYSFRKAKQIDEVNKVKQEIYDVKTNGFIESLSQQENNKHTERFKNLYKATKKAYQVFHPHLKQALINANKNLK